MDEAYQLVQLRHPRQFSTTLHDHYSLEPWEKNTLQTEQAPKAYLTFYQGTSQPIPNAAFSTQRALSLSRHQQLSRKSQRIERRQLSWKKSLGEVPQQRAVVQYNITGNFLTEPPVKRSFNNRFFLRGKQKKGRSKVERLRDTESPISSLAQMRKRFSFQKQSSQQPNFQFVRLNSEKDQQRQKISTCPASSKQKRKGKVISIGFRKISTIRSLIKQKSMNVEAFPF